MSRIRGASRTITKMRELVAAGYFEITTKGVLFLYVRGMEDEFKYTITNEDSVELTHNDSDIYEIIFKVKK